MKKLWLTYAWKDNEDKDVDFIVQELSKTGIDVRFDRRQIIPGRRLWPQIAEFIENPSQSDAWAILLTANSLRSQACKEELSYALDRALHTKGQDFPMFALLHQVAYSEVPAALRIRLGISLEDADWTGRVLAAVEAVSPDLRPGGVSDFALTEHSVGDRYWLEIRPRFERIAPFAVVVDYDEKESGNVIDCSLGPAGLVPKVRVAYGWLESEGTLSDGTRVWVWQASKEASSTFSYYISYLKRPRRIWSGRPDSLRMLSLGGL